MITTPIYLIVKLVFLQLYPAYMCFKAIKVQDANQFSPLIIYWMVTSIYLVIEYIADIFIFWFPFYYELKLIIILWLILPQTNGTMMLYSQYMEPFLTANESMIDQTVVDIQQNVKSKISTFAQKAIHFLRTFISDSLFKPSEVTTVEESTVAPDKNTTDLWSPYGIFAALMTATSEYQLTHGSLKKDPQSSGTTTTKTTTTSTAPIETSSSSSSSSTTPPTDSEGDTIMERVDSYDSLTSIVFNGRKGDTSDNTTTAPLPPLPSTSTWTGYVSSWIWKPETSSVNRKTKQA